MNRFLEIDALRAFAAFLILIAHTAQEMSKLPGADPNALALHHFFWNIDLGRSAVIIFFSISGYVMCSTIKGQRLPGSIDFWGRRLFRLYPVFWLSNLTVIALIFWPDGNINIGQIIANATMLPKVFGYENLLGVYWTLETELMFYFLAWLIFILGFHNRPQAHAFMCIGLVALTFFFVFNRDVAPKYHYWMAMPYHISAMFWAALYRSFNDSPTERVNFKLFTLSIKSLFVLVTVIILLPAFFALMLHIRYDSAFGLRNSASYIIGILGFVTLTRWLPLRVKLLAHFGNYTYTIYLFHVIVIMSLVNLIKSYAPSLAGWPIAIWILTVFAISIVIGHFVFNYVEKPVMKYSQQIFRSKKA